MFSMFGLRFVGLVQTRVDQLVRVVSRSLAEGRPDGGRASRVRACASLSPPLSLVRPGVCVSCPAGEQGLECRRAVAERSKSYLWQPLSSARVKLWFSAGPRDLYESLDDQIYFRAESRLYLWVRGTGPEVGS